MQWYFLAWGLAAGSVLSAVAVVCVKLLSIRIVSALLALACMGGSGFYIHQIVSTEVVRYYGVLQELPACPRAYLENSHHENGVLVQRLHRTDLKKALKYCTLATERIALRQKMYPSAPPLGPSGGEHLVGLVDIK